MNPDVSYLKCPVCKLIRRVTNLRRYSGSIVYSYDNPVPVTLTHEEDVALTLAGRVLAERCPGCAGISLSYDP